MIRKSGYNPEAIPDLVRFGKNFEG
jgi:hypothetical protein